jgi:hypothetical protein
MRQRPFRRCGGEKRGTAAARSIVSYSTMRRAKSLRDVMLQQGMATVQSGGHGIRTGKNCWVIRISAQLMNYTHVSNRGGQGVQSLIGL